MDIKRQRKAIDDIDARLLRLLTQRVKAALGLARLKQKLGLPPRDAAREAEVLGRARKTARSPLTPQAAQGIMAAIMRGTRASVRKRKRA
ncbi:MAG: chorismate mutase [Planctomycetes bacterium]|nr:chorismate mutase [Planctomycetota bacterium]